MFTVVKPYKIDEIITNSTQRCTPLEKNTDSHDIFSNPLPSVRFQSYSFVIKLSCRYCQEIKDVDQNFGLK